MDRIEEFSNGLECKVPINLETDGTYRFFGHGKIIAAWIPGDPEDDLLVYGINREPRPTKGYLLK